MTIIGLLTLADRLITGVRDKAVLTMIEADVQKVRCARL